MRDVEPVVIRVIDVPESSTLPELHLLLQAAVGWTDSHLHQFVAGEATYGVPDADAWEEQRDETGVRLKDLPARFRYLYDFGDGWEHDIDVAILATDGPQRDVDLAGRAHALLGPGWMRDSRPLSVDDVRGSIWGLSAVLRGLDLAESDGRIRNAGPSALTVLPRATALAALWARPRSTVS